MKKFCPYCSIKIPTYTLMCTRCASHRHEKLYPPEHLLILCPACSSKPTQMPCSYAEVKYGCHNHFYYFITDETLTGFLINIILSEDSFLQFSWHHYKNKTNLVMWNKKQPSIYYDSKQDYIPPKEAYKLLTRYHKLLPFS